MTPVRWWAGPSAVVLVAAAASGAWWRGQPAGPYTTALVEAAVASCTVAVLVPDRDLVVGDGARAIDAWAWAVAADRIEGVRTRCPGAGRSADRSVSA